MKFVIQEINNTVCLGQLGQKWSTIKHESVLTIVVYGKVELPSSWRDKVTGCSRR